MAQYKTFGSMQQDKVNLENSNVGFNVPVITSLQQRKQLINQHFLTVIDYYTEWCGPCQTSAPKYAQLAQKYSKPGLCVLAKENAENGVGGLPVDITGVPCFHFYVNGQFISSETVTGADIEKLEETITRILNSIQPN